MSSSNSNTSLSIDQSKPSQQNVLERVADRSAKKILFKKHGCNLCLGKREQTIKTLKCHESSHQKMVPGRILSLKNTNKWIWKKYSRQKKINNNLKLDPQNIELKEPKIYRIVRSKNTYSPNARNSYNTFKHITKLRTIKKK